MSIKLVKFDFVICLFVDCCLQIGIQWIWFKWIQKPQVNGIDLSKFWHKQNLKHETNTCTLKTLWKNAGVKVWVLNFFKYMTVQEGGTRINESIGYVINMKIKVCIIYTSYWVYIKTMTKGEWPWCLSHLIKLFVCPLPMNWQKKYPPQY